MALIKSGRVALQCFIIGIGLFLSSIVLSSVSSLVDYFVHYVIFYMTLSNVLVYVMYRDCYDVAIRALILGLAFSLSFFLALSLWSCRLLGWYLCILCLFHWGEYFVTAVSNPRNLSLESFLLDHSREYHIAVAASIIEFLLECILFSSLKQPNWLSVIGLFVIVAGDVFRKLAMLTAKTNFNHYVQHRKQHDHELVTSGIYSLVRHPSYVGWFYWSIGNQIMLCNPVCTVAFAYVSWRFFRDRIVTEEIALINFFGEDYLAYQKAVGTGIPFITGYQMEV